MAPSFFCRSSSGRSHIPARRHRPRPFVPRLEGLEDRLTPANLTLTNAILVDIGGHALTGPPVTGEEVAVEAFWDTQGLAAGASYRISYAVDGVTQYAGPFTVGAGGSGVQSWAWYLRGWFAAPGTHTVTVTVDADNSVAETNEADNTRTFTFTPASATDLPQKFVTPLGGTPFQTWGIVNYLDVDPRAGSARAFRGGPYQYDGHTGINTTLAKA